MQNQLGSEIARIGRVRLLRYNQRKQNNIGDLISETLMLIEQNASAPTVQGRAAGMPLHPYPVSLAVCIAGVGELKRELPLVGE